MKKLTLLFTAMLTVFLFALPAYAADITLSSRCTLADAIIAANNDQAEGDCPAGRGADTITLSQDITLRVELSAITSDITIEGNGYTISGDNHYRIFYNDGGALTIHDLMMIEGRAEGDELITNADGSLKNTTANPIGGAVVNWAGTLTIIGSSFSGNSAERGGAIDNTGDGKLSIRDSAFSGNSAVLGGVISNWDGRVRIYDSAFQNNSAEGRVWSGGAILNAGDGELSINDSTFSNNLAHGGGAIDNWGELSIRDSTFSNNLAHGGGAIVNRGELSISSSAFSYNSVESGGGAILNWGDLSISSSTFSYNWAVWGGAIDNAGDEKLSITNSTFSDNSAEWRGGAIDNRGELSMTNTIIAGGDGDACYSEGRLKLNIRNFIQDGSCSLAFRGDPMLGALVVPADGSPAYFPLLAGSRAIDAADDDYCPETDQVGTARPQGAGCDIGAFEYVVKP